MEQIAEQAEYAKGTIYRHFPSKDDVYARLVVDWNAETCRQLEAIDADQPFGAVLREVIGVSWRRMTADRVHSRLINHVQRADFLAGISDSSRSQLAEIDGATLGLLSGLIDWGIAEGAIPALPLEPRLFAVTALLTGALRLHPLWGDSVETGDPEQVLCDAVIALLGAGSGRQNSQSGSR